MTAPRVASDPAELFESAAAGDQRALARLLSYVEAGGPSGHEVVRRARAQARGAWVVGVTGAPGAGKSTLIGALAAHARTGGLRVAVVAVDPTSPHSGGALLADRARLLSHAGDEGVFVRSMATRGCTGGLAAATAGAVSVLDATGWPVVLVETVGAGQVGVEVASVADTTVVVLTPGWGDSLQVAKAGMLEVADVLVVNKADRAGADGAAGDLAAHLALGPSSPWRPPVVQTVATTGSGVAELWSALERHRAHRGAGTARLERAAAELRRLAGQAGARAARARCQGPAFEGLAADVAQGLIAAEVAVARLLGPGPGETSRPG